MNNFLLKFTVFIIFSTIISGCVTILSPKEQSIRLVTNDTLTKIYLFDSLIAGGKEATIILPKDRNIRQLKLELNGYKPNNYVIAPVNTSPLYYRNFFLFFLVFPLFEPSYSYKLKTYDDVYEFDKKFYKEPIWEPTKKKLIVKNVYIELNKDSNSQILYNLIDYHDGNEPLNIFELDTVGLTNTKFNDYLNENVLKKGNFIETLNPSTYSQNTLLIDCKINKKVNYHISTFNSIFGKELNDAFVTELGVIWYVKDYAGNILYQKEVECKSGEFILPLVNTEPTIQKIYEDAIHNSFLELFEDEKFENLCKIK